MPTSSSEQSQVKGENTGSYWSQRKVHHLRFKSRDRQNTQSDSTSPYTSPDESGQVLPSSTTEWSINCLELLGIYYDMNSKSYPSDILDLVYRETKVFRPLSNEQKDEVKRLQDSLTFDFNLTDILMRRSDLNKTAQEFREEMKQNILALQSPLDSITIEFINSLILIMKYQVAYAQADRSSPVPKEVFTDMFKLFVRMCHLIPIPGKAWKTGLCIKKTSVISESDVVILPGSYLDDATETFSVVSVEGVKNSSSYKNENEDEQRKPRLLKSSISSESLENQSSVYLKPCIFQRIDKNTLGKHGGELLIHHKLNKDLIEARDFKCVPGMVVNGTEVTLTLLVLNPFHLSDLLRGVTIRKEDGSYIHYSEPRDLLNKCDRDMLIESFARLNNV